MKIPCLLEIDFEKTPIGTKSRLDEKVGDKTVLEWSVFKARALPFVSKVCLAGRAKDLARAGELLSGGEVEFVETPKTGAVEGSRYVRRRKWALPCWQGGIAQATVHDEDGHPATMNAVFARTGSNILYKMPAAAPLVDEALAVKMLDEFQEHADLKISNAPPGAGGAFYSKRLASAMNETSRGIDGMLALDMDRPVREPMILPIGTYAPQALAGTRVRLIADTRRGMELLQSLHEKYGDNWIHTSAVEIAEYLNSNPSIMRGGFPREIEIEVTTRHEADSPERKITGIRGEKDIEVEEVKRILDSFDECDDLLVTLGGYGDPLLHPHFEEVIQACGGVFGLHVRTDGLSLDEKKREILTSGGVDMVSMALDAASEEVYEKFKGHGGLEKVSENTENLIRMVLERGEGPLVLPEFTRRGQGFDELDSFYRRWHRTAQWVVVRTQDDLAGRIDGEFPPPLLLGERGVCEHILERMFFDVCNEARLCLQDFNGESHLRETGPGEAWRGRFMERLRNEHLKGDFSGFVHCKKCKRWCVQ